MSNLRTQALVRRAQLAALLGLAVVGCDSVPDGRAHGRGAGGGATLHLDALLAEATVVSAGAPESAARRLEWDLGAERAEAPAETGTTWTTLSSEVVPWLAKIERTPLPDGTRLALAMPDARRTMLMAGGVATELSELRLGDWEAVEVRARTDDRFGGITIAYNHEEEGALPQDLAFFFSTDEAPPVFSDGSEQVYSIPIRHRRGDDADTPLESLAVVVAAPDPGTLDLLEIALVPRGAGFREDYGMRPVHRDGVSRPSIYTHTPSEIRYPLTVPDGGRLDVGLTVDGSDRVRYSVEVDGEPIWSETASAEDRWAQHSIDLSASAGRTVELTLRAQSDSPHSVALWGSPIVSGTSVASAERPNVVFYVIDGAGADLMSVYGYERKTTPFLEELAAEAVVFERAHSNSTWTQPSTASFMTSLQHSVLGGLRRGVHSTPIPTAAKTMAEHLRESGYLTVSLTTNPNAGRIIGNDRGVDLLSDTNSDHHSTSSVDLHERFWEMREDYPAEPYWVHFQTTDVHEPNEPTSPHAGRFVEGEDRKQVSAWDQRIFQVAFPEFGQRSVQTFYDIAIERAEIDRQRYFSTRRGLYDETMLHQDEQLRHFVDKLKADGEWENTLLIIGSDHGHPAGTFARFGRGLLDPQPEPWQGALFDAYATRVPLLFVWPARIEGGRRFTEPVSMIDVLPTLLDLLGLDPPEVVQGQSLAPFLLGDDEMAVRPVILDEFRVDEASGELVGNLEIIDGRWGASLEIGPRPEGSPSNLGRHIVPVGGRWGARHEYYAEPPRVLLYDLETDPFATRAVNSAHPDLVDRYTRLLLEQWDAHQALATRFQEVSEVALDPAQLEQLRSLGYIQ